MNADMKAILDRAQKLQALADRAGTPEEAANAASKLQSMLLRHNLTMAQVAGNIQEDFEKQDFSMSHENRNHKGWKSTLYYGIAKANFCESVWNPRSSTMSIVGRKANIDMVHYLYGYLSLEIIRLAGQASRNQPNKAVYFRAFCIGAMSSVLKRMQAEKEEVRREASQNNALMIVEDRAVYAEFKRHFPRTSKGSGPSVGSRSGLDAGREAGRGIGIRSGIGQRGGQLALT